MNLDSQLKLQAYLDGELPPDEAKEIARFLEADPEARDLYLELKSTHQLLSGNEPEIKLPESRDFYWSKIERQIHQLEPQSKAPARSPWSGWLRFAAPMAGLAVIAIALLITLNPERTPQDLSILKTIETPVEDASLISFHSEEAGMTVVWLGNIGN
ncbi:MAG: hypothetical protein AB1813_29525 [Verrucomicrobiota bacterium]|jgi:anti-sigma factor RsiW